MNTWSEDDSALYRQIVDTAVPRRREQIATLLTLLPVGPDDAGRVVELGCGPGALSWAILDAYPQATVTALDGSQSMLRHAAERLVRFGDRMRFARFDLGSMDWLGELDGADAVLSSLCLHHLDGPEKRRFYAAARERIAPGGALLVADLIAARTLRSEELFRESWDEYARLSSQETGSLFEREQWNFYRYPDPADKPSGLFEQLGWLDEAGFTEVDCFWMDAGHAIFGGYARVAQDELTRPALSYGRALEIAERAIAATRQGRTAST